LEPNIIKRNYDDLLETILVGFDAPSSETSLKYYPNFGKIEILDDLRKVIYTKETSSYSNEIVVPTEYHGKKIYVKVRACADPTRLETKEQCGENAKEVVLQLSPIAVSNERVFELNNVLNDMMLNEDQMQEICQNFKKVSDAFLAVGPESNNPSQASLIATAQMASFDAKSFMTLCSSFMLDDIFEARKDLSEGDNSAGLLLTNTDCNGFGDTGTGTGTDEGGRTLSQLADDCNNRDGYVWNSETEQCDAEATDPLEIDYTKQKEDCLAKTDDNAEFTWDEEGNVCVQTVTKTEEVAGEAECIKEQGTWDSEKNSCIIKTAEVSSFNDKKMSINSINVTGQCLQVGDSNSVKSLTCLTGKEAQLFSFTKTDDNKVVIENIDSSGESEAKVCLKLGEKAEDADTYPLVTGSCSDDPANEYKFELIDITYDADTKLYRTFKSTIKDTEGNYYCIQKSDGDVDPEATVCKDITDKDTKAPQLFELNFYEEPAEGSAGKVADYPEISRQSSLASEGGTKAGKQCIEVSNDDNELSLKDCNTDSGNQLFLSQGTGQLQTFTKKEGETGSNVCIDYSTDASNPKAAECEDKGTQRLSISTIGVLFEGETKDFQMIMRNDGALDQCLTVDSSKFKFDDCKFNNGNTVTTKYEDLKAQLFTVVAGGGDRTDYESGEEDDEKGWFHDPKNPFAPETKDAWLTAVTAGLIVAGVGLLAHAVIPEPINRIASAATTPFKQDRWVRTQTIQDQFARNGSTTIVRKYDYEVFKTQGYQIKTVDGGETQILDRNKQPIAGADGKPLAFNEFGKAEIPLANNRSIEVYQSRGQLRSDLQRQKFQNNPDLGKNSAPRSWKKGFAGAILFSAGVYFSTNSPGAGLVAESLPDCIQLDSKNFSELSQSAAFSKFLCEVGGLEFKLAQLHKTRESLINNRDSVLEAHAKEKEDL
ncbi:MAG: hypothetical protein AB8F95_08495, partial [Bacteroidia bacterium]